MAKRSTKFKLTFNAPVTLCFCAACFAVTLLGYLGINAIDSTFAVYRAPLSEPMTYLRFFTHVFGHGGWEHFLGNVSYLLLLGPILEEKYGSEQLVGVIAITALVTGIMHFILFPGIALCGASGVVFAFILLASYTNFRSGEIPVTFILVAVVFIGQQVFDGLFVKDNISNSAHIVGGIVGAILGYTMNGRKRRR